MDDILSKFWTLYQGLIHSAPPAVYAFLLRANVALLCPIITAHIGFVNRWRHPAAQALLIIFGVLIGLSIPLGRVVEAEMLKPWLTPIFVIGILFLPHLLAFHCTPHLGAQKTLGFRIFVSIVALFTLNLLIAVL